jgi:HEAT repeats
MQGDVLLRAKLTALRNGKVPPEELYNLIHTFGNEGFLEAEPDVVALLNHPDARFRELAVRVLTYHWDLRKHRDELIRLLRHDPDYKVRFFTAGGMGFVFRDSRDPVVSQALIDKIRDNDEDTYMRGSAYDALRKVWSKHDPADFTADWKERDKAYDAASSRKEALGMLWMWEQENLLKIDWEFVERIERTMRGESSGSGHSSTR